MKGVLRLSAGLLGSAEVRMQLVMHLRSGGIKGYAVGDASVSFTIRRTLR